MADVVDPKITRHNLTTLLQLERGDLVEFYRGPYSHWGVYLGDEKIVHLAGEENDGINAQIKPEHVFTICGIKFDKARVAIDNFMVVAGSSKAYKNNSKDSKEKPLHPEEIVKNALSRIGEVGYSLIYANCEHFAKWCRYGVAKSDQVDSVITGAAVGIASALVLGVVWAFTKSPSKEEEEEKKQTA